MNTLSSLELDVSRETSDRLSTYKALLQKWNAKINLVSPNTMSDIDTRHFRDSAQVFTKIPKTAKTLLDLGSGGGFPGLILAILAAELHPSLAVTLIESDQRKCSFLRTVLRETGVTGHVIAKRILDVPPKHPDVITARALSSLTALLSFAYHHQTPDTVSLFLKGRNWKSERSDAREIWNFTDRPHKSKTDSDAVLLEVRDIQYA